MNTPESSAETGAGADGQIGWELRRSLAPLGEVVALDRRACDLARPAALPGIVGGVLLAASRAIGRKYGGATYGASPRATYTYYYFNPWGWSSQAAHWAMMLSDWKISAMRTM